MAELGYTASEFYHSTPIEIDSALEYKDKKREYDTYTNVRPIAKAYRDWETDRKSTRLNSSHSAKSRMPSSA